MGYMIQISEDKRDKMSSLCEKVLRAAGTLMQCLDDIDADQQHMGERREYIDDEEYDDVNMHDGYGRYGRIGMRRNSRTGRYMR